MHRIAIVLALLAALPVLAACRASEPRASAEEELILLLRAQQDAWNAGEVERFVELGYWRSPELTFFSGGAITKGYEPLVERYRQRYVESGEGMGTLSFSGLEPFRLGADAAMVRGRWRLERDAGPVGGLFTLVLRRLDGAWRIVHDHTSLDDPGS